MIEYGTVDSWVWHGSPGVVRFQVSDNGKPIQCRVSLECIEDHCGNPTGDDACFTAAKEHFGAIKHQVGSLIDRGRFEADGSIFLRTGDRR